MLGMSEFRPLIEELFREEVLRTRQSTPEERLSQAFELADLAYGAPDPDLEARVERYREMQTKMYYGPPQPRL